MVMGERDLGRESCVLFPLYDVCLQALTGLILNTTLVIYFKYHIGNVVTCAAAPHGSKGWSSPCTAHLTVESPVSSWRWFSRAKSLSRPAS